MWIAIFCVAFVAAGACTAYLCVEVYGILPKSSPLPQKTDKPLRIFTGLYIVFTGFTVLSLVLGYINALIVVVHYVVFRLLCGLLFFTVRKIRGKNFKFNFAALFAMTATLIYLGVGYALANTVVTTHYGIATQKAVGDLRIVMFADSHIGSTFDGDGFAEYVQRMQDSSPDIVIVAGDYVDDDTSREDMAAACRALGKLKTTYGVYYAFGNHDKGYYDDSRRSFTAAELIDELEKNNVVVLRDEIRLIDDRFYVIGRNEAEENRRGEGRADIEELTADLDKSKFSIVINHQPTDYAAEAKAGVDLVLSGHTHGGQMFPIGMISDLFGLNDKVYGHEKINGTDFIVPSGISDWAIKFKTGCRSEFVVIDIQGCDMNDR